MSSLGDKGVEQYTVHPQIIHFHSDHLGKFSSLQNQVVVSEKPKATKKRRLRNDLIIEDRHYQGLENYYSPDETSKEEEPEYESDRWISLSHRSISVLADSPIDLSQYTEFNPNNFSTLEQDIYELKTNHIKLSADKTGELLYLNSTTLPSLRSDTLLSLNFTHKDLIPIKAELDILCLPASRLKYPHIDVKGPHFQLTFNVPDNKITINFDYHISIRESITSFFPPEISNKFSPLISLVSTTRPTQFEASHQYEQLADEPINPELFYKTVATHASRLPPVTQDFDIPELETNLLPFQKKTVGWLLQRENVVYDWETNRCIPVKLISDSFYASLEAVLKDGSTTGEEIDNQTSEFLNKICFGWIRITFHEETFWFNSFTGNLCSSKRMCQHLVTTYQYLESKRQQYSPAKGLLAEEMGLGKTVEVAALSLLHRRSLEDLNEPIEIRLRSYGDLKTVIKAKTTLVVAPDSILKQWVEEVMRLAPSLAVTVYQGVDKYPRLRGNAGMIAEYLRRFDIVFTTYTMISKELDYALYSARNKPTRTASKRKSMVNEAVDSKSSVDPGREELLQKYTAMFQLTIRTEKPKVANLKSGDDAETDYEKALQDELELSIEHNNIPDIYRNQEYQSPLMLSQFWRVVLDEVQMVSSKFSRAFQSAALIPRFHAWGVSGTPIKKDFNDLHSILKFLKLDPFVGELAKNSWARITSKYEPNANESFVSLWSQIGIRHTKDMVHDDIQLPEQRRILMTVPFSLVEQENYNQLFEDFLASVCLDINGNPVLEDWDPSPTILAYMRSWLVRLRQVCSNPQIGNLNLNSKRYRSRNSSYNNRIVATVQQLKTLDKVLDDMLEKASDQITEAERSIISTYVEVGQFLEFILLPEDALGFLSVGSYEAEKVIHRLKLVLKKTASKYQELRKRENLTPLDDDDDFDTIDESESSASKKKHEGSEIIFKYEEQIRTIRMKIRSWLTLLHKFYFLIASCHFQCYDAEYGEKIEKLQLKSFKVSSSLYRIKENDFTDEVASFISEIPQEQLQTSPRTTSDVKGNKEETHRALEQQYYDFAEHTRQDLLKGSIKSVEKVVKSRITNRGWYDDNGKLKEDNGDVLLPKTSRKFFRFAPTINVSHLKDETVGIRQTLYFDKVKRISDQLNAQALVINKWMSTLVEILCKPLVSHDKDPNGEEYEQSIVDQDLASCYLHALTQILSDRGESVNGNENATKITTIQKSQEKKEFELEASRVHDKDFLEQLQAERLAVKVNVRSSLQELVLELRQLENETEGEEILDREATQVYHEMLNSMGQKIRNIFENQKLALVLLQRELNLSCNAVFNSRIDYFKQLQLISDSVKTKHFSMDQEALDLKLVQRQQQSYINLSSNLSIKKGKAIAKFRYLKSLSGGTMSNEPKNNEELMCIICRSTITIGSLTQCGHKYCKECLERWLVTSKTCPLCKTAINASTVYNFTHYKPDLKANKIADRHKPAKNLHSIYHPVDNVVVEDIQNIELKNFYSSKVDTIVRHVLYLRSQNPRVQIVIFSQWQDLLYILGTAFKAADISYLGSYGTLTPEVGSGRRRNKYDSVEEFKDPSNNITCFLLNAKAQASGLTLINATHIFLCEPLVNASLELQAISRIHRIGQTKVTTVWLFAIENTVEESILLMSTNKRLGYLESKDGDIAGRISQSSERDLTKAESMALMTSGGIDTMINKGNGEGETVTNNDLWSAFFCAQTNESSKAGFKLGT
ncbi:hypothetical protein QA089_000437 [Meyerozyma guilliermondii]